MIKSMTGYGSAKGTIDGLSIVIELKSVNNKFNDTSIRMPRSFIFAEEAIKSEVQKHISRGKIDVFVTVDSSQSDDMTVKINEPLLNAYIDALNYISEKYSVPNDMTTTSLSRIPDILTTEKKELDNDSISKGLCEIAELALNDFDKMRIREGEKLKEDIENRLKVIENYVSVVEAESPKTVEDYQQRLYQKMSEILENKSLDDSRILQEAAMFADHIAVDEETVRLRSHISQMKEMLELGSPIGRKIDFLIQEFNREANTIGSKCQNSEIAHVVVNLKSEIEKIREQIQNIE